MHRTKPRVTKFRLALLSLAVTIAAVLPASQATADDNAQKCLSAGNVWVVVDQDGSIKGGCATKFSNGIEALQSAGFKVTESGGFLTKINGQPEPAGSQDWWSYWNNTPDSNGKYPGWKSYEIGAATSKPKPGSVEGWNLWHSFDQSKPAKAPGSDPVANFVLKKSTETDSKSPTAKSTKTASVKPTKKTNPVGPPQSGV